MEKSVWPIHTMMMARSVLVLSLGLVLAVTCEALDGYDLNCPRSDLAIVTNEFKKCEQFADDQFMKSITFDSLCVYISEVTSKCTQSYSRCLDERQLQEKRELTLRVLADKLIKIFGIGRNVEYCSDVVDLKRRYGSQSFEFPTPSCKIEQIKSAVDEFHKCASNSNSRMTFRIRSDILSPEGVQNLVCETSREILSTCIKSIANCYEAPDLDIIQSHQRKYLRHLLFPFAHENGINLNDCPSLRDSRVNLSTGLLSDRMSYLHPTGFYRNSAISDLKSFHKITFLLILISLALQ